MFSFNKILIFSGLLILLHELVLNLYFENCNVFCLLCNTFFYSHSVSALM